MSTITKYFNSSVVLLRLSATTGYKKGYISTGTIDVHLQRIDERSQSATFAAEGVTHRAWIGLDVNIKDGDQVRDAQGNLYSVVAVINEGRDIAINEHKEVLLRIYQPPVLPKES